MSQLRHSISQGYSVSKRQILAWVNNILLLSLTKIEQLGNGAVYCQLLDSLFEGRVALQKLNWKARYDYEITPNYKVLQAAFDHLGIEKRLQVQHLCMFKTSYNLELIQWLKRYIELQGGSSPFYEPIARRGKKGIDCELPFSIQSTPNNKENRHSSKNQLQKYRSVPSMKLSQGLRFSVTSPSSRRASISEREGLFQSREGMSQYFSKRVGFSIGDIPFIDEEDEVI